MVHTLEVKEIKIITVETQIPCYRKSYSGMFCYYAYDEKKAIQICDYDGCLTINEVSINLAFDSSSEECSREEFMKMYERATRSIEAKLFPVFDDPIKSDDSKIIVA